MTENTAPSAASTAPSTTSTAADDGTALVTESLVEEVSIDGMCGVY